MSDLEHISHSQVNLWLSCPRQWFYRYVEGLKSPPSGALILGSSYHKALEANFIQKVGTMTDLPVAEVLDVFSDHWESRMEEEDIEWAGFRPGAMKDQGITIVNLYHVNEAPKIQPVAVEIWYEKMLSGVKFVGSVDLVEAKGTVIDHKTSSKAYNQDDVNKDIQATAEAFMVGRPINHEFHVAVKTKVPTIQKCQSVRTAEDILWWMDMVRGVVAQMQTGIAPPNPTIGWKCSERYCGYWSLCRGDLTRSYSVPGKGE